MTTMFKSGTTKRHGTTHYGSSSTLSNKKATMSSSYGAPSTSRSAKFRHSPSTSRRSHDKAIAKSDKLRHSPSTSRRRHEKDNAKSAKPRHSTSTQRRHPKKCIDKAKLSQGPSSSSRRHKNDTKMRDDQVNKVDAPLDKFGDTNRTFKNLMDAIDNLAKRLHSSSRSRRRHKKDAKVDHNMSKLQDDISSLAKLRNISPRSSGSSKTRSPKQQARRRRHEETHPNDFRRQFSSQERQRRHEEKS